MVKPERLSRRRTNYRPPATSLRPSAGDSINVMVPVTEAEIRACVRAQETDDTGRNRLVDEFVIGDQGRIDLAVIGRSFRGYEIKSDLDSLYRLPRQMEVFEQVFDYCTLVVTKRHLSAARESIAAGWGLAVVARTEQGTLTYRCVRRARLSKRQSEIALARLLWRDEALAALDFLGHSKGLRSKPRDVLWAKLADVASLDELRALVRDSLMVRRGWRDGTAPHADDGTSPPEGVSSRFLARRLRMPRR